MIAANGRIRPGAPPCPFRFQEQLKPYTTWKIGGPADIFCRPTTFREFIATVHWARKNSLPVSILGGGSNVLVADEGVEGVVIHTGDLKQLEIVPPTARCEDPVVFAAAGVTMDYFCQWTAEHGLRGSARLGGLPGTIGGAVFMNARCHELSVSDILDTVYFIDPAGRFASTTASLSHYSYKSSLFQTEGLSIVGASFRLRRDDDPATLREETRRWKQLRIDSGQFSYPNAGCVFKNDYSIGIPAGKLIDQAGLKGKRINEAAIYERHANFIVNLGTATASDVYELIRTIESAVLQATGVSLQREIRLLGRWALSGRQ